MPRYLLGERDQSNRLQNAMILGGRRGHRRVTPAQPPLRQDCWRIVLGPGAVAGACGVPERSVCAWTVGGCCGNAAASSGLPMTLAMGAGVVGCPVAWLAR
jgi:hypothetical protein